MGFEKENTPTDTPTWDLLGLNLLELRWTNYRVLKLSNAMKMKELLVYYGRKKTALDKRFFRIWRRVRNAN